MTFVWVFPLYEHSNIPFEPRSRSANMPKKLVVCQGTKIRHSLMTIRLHMIAENGLRRESRLSSTSADQMLMLC